MRFPHHHHGCCLVPATGIALAIVLLFAAWASAADYVVPANTQIWDIAKDGDSFVAVHGGLLSKGFYGRGLASLSVRPASEKKSDTFWMVDAGNRRVLIFRATDIVEAKP
jgi:hypothetical protein